ncbi:hypothetical protein [Rhizobium sp. GCM10022189]|uniref:hypothetical protein n=1 Tax=Rhizobium sp. GCM10022189 TaxID=3252654 RepID=UPI00360B001D
MDHVTPFGARVEPPPVIIVERRPAVPRWVPEILCPLLWAVAMLLLVYVGSQTWRRTGELDQQIAWEERV